MSVVVNAENIKQFNSRLAEHKAKVQRLQMQVEMQEKEVETQLKKLTETLGVPVTEENVAQLYEQYKTELENQLTNGIAILDRIEGKAVAQPNMAQPSAVQQQPTMMPGAFGYGQPAQPAIQTAPPQTAQQFPPQFGTPVATVGQPIQQATPPFPSQLGTPVATVGQPLNAGMPEQAPQQNPFSGFAQTMGNFDAQSGVDMNSFGKNNGVFGV